MRAHTMVMGEFRMQRDKKYWRKQTKRRMKPTDDDYICQARLCWLCLEIEIVHWMLHEKPFRTNTFAMRHQEIQGNARAIYKLEK